MVRVFTGGFLVVLLAGCTREEDYFEVAREQRSAFKELTDVLATIKDDASMKSAKTALDEKLKKFDAIARKAKAMPAPPPEVSKRMREDGYLMEGALKALQLQVKRVSKLDGGTEFLKQFESTSPGLFSAVQP